MNSQTILVAIIALLIGGIGGYTLNEYKAMDHSQCMMDMGTNEQTGSKTTMNMAGMEGMHMMPDGTMMGMDHMNMSVSSERDFLLGMIPHHQEAVDTAKEVLARGATTQEMKTLMNSIVTAQEKEISEMKSWYQNWYNEPYQDNGNYQPMMRDLSQLSGTEIDKAFLEDMIMHHMGAIMMSRSVESYIENTEIANLTKAIIESQTREIEQMRRMHNEL